MNEETLKLLEQLASKLGTTAESLWTVLIRQASIAATVHLCFTVLIIIIGIILWKINKRFNENDGTMSYRYNNSLSITMGITTIIWTVFFVGQFAKIDVIVNGFFNPEYWALMEILNALK